MQWLEVSGLERPSFSQGLRRLVDILTEAYTTLNRRPWILAIPIGLDLFLWIGPRILPSHLGNALASGWQEMLQRAPGYLQIEPEWATQVTEALRDWGAHSNVARFLSASVIPLLVPRLSNPALPGFTPPAWAPASIWILLPVFVATIALGLLLWGLYLVPVADLIRESEESGREMLRRTGVAWWRMIRLVFIVPFVVFIFALPASFLTSVSSIISPTVSLLFLYLGIGFVLWMLFYLYFAPNAILLSGVGPLRAIYYSMQVVRSSLWQSLGFVLLSLMIRIGTISLWQRLASWSPGVLLAILANAYIVSGLATASMIYYRDRLREWLADKVDVRGGVAG
jgi:hypothetical protein